MEIRIEEKRLKEPHIIREPTHCGMYFNTFIRDGDEKIEIFWPKWLSESDVAIKSKESLEAYKSQKIISEIYSKSG